MGETGWLPTDTLQGWCSDPYDRHEDRWFSQGIPTALVRDGLTESQDPPPAGPPSVGWVKPPGARDRTGDLSSDHPKTAALRSTWLWSGVAVAGLLLLAVGLLFPAPTGQPAPIPMKQSAVATARSTATVADITPPLCFRRLGNNNEPAVEANDADAGRSSQCTRGRSSQSRLTIGRRFPHRARRSAFR